MRKLAVDYYSAVFGEEECDLSNMEVLLTELANLGMAQREALDENLWLQELTTRVCRLSLGKAPGIDGLPAEFYTHFWE